MTSRLIVYVYQESERKRKQLEANLSEATIRLQEIERAKADTDEKVIKLQVRMTSSLHCCDFGFGENHHCCCF